MSTDGGVEPRWRGDGRELFFLSGADMMAVEVRTTATSFEAGKPRPLFSIIDLSTVGGRNRYVVTRDGSRFLMLVPTQTSRNPLRIALNALPPR